MSDTPELLPTSGNTGQPIEPSRHGYWGPLPGESPELYKALGAPAMERAILRWVPDFFRGNFNMEAGRDLGVAVGPEKIPDPAELTPQGRLERFVDFTKTNEAAHVVTFAVVGALAIGGTVAEGGWLGTSIGAFFTAANVVANIPPIIVQRYNRLRAYRLLDKMARLRSTASPEEQAR